MNELLVYIQELKKPNLSDPEWKLLTEILIQEENKSSKHIAAILIEINQENNGKAFKPDAIKQIRDYINKWHNAVRLLNKVIQEKSGIYEKVTGKKIIAEKLISLLIVILPSDRELLINALPAVLSAIEFNSGINEYVLTSLYTAMEAKIKLGDSGNFLNPAFNIENDIRATLAFSEKLELIEQITNLCENFKLEKTFTLFRLIKENDKIAYLYYYSGMILDPQKYNEIAIIILNDNYSGLNMLGCRALAFPILKKIQLAQDFLHSLTRIGTSLNEKAIEFCQKYYHFMNSSDNNTLASQFGQQFLNGLSNLGLFQKNQEELFFEAAAEFVSLIEAEQKQHASIAPVHQF